MKKDTFKLKKEIGAFYSGGPVLKIPNSKKIIFPTGNSVSIIDILNGKIQTLNFRFRDFIVTIDIDKKGKILAVIDNSNLLTIINIEEEKIKGRIILKDNCFLIKFSPREKYFAIALPRQTQVWKYGVSDENNFYSFQLSRTYGTHQSQICCLDWNFSGDFFVSAEKGGFLKVFSFRRKNQVKGFHIKGFFEKIITVKFFDFSKCILVVCKNNVLFTFDFFEKKKHKIKEKNSLSLYDNFVIKYKISEKYKTMTSSFTQKLSEIFFIGFSNGDIGFYNFKKILKKIKNKPKVYCSRKILTLGMIEIFSYSITSFSVCFNHNFFSMGNRETGRILIFDKKKKKIVILHQNYLENPTCLCFSKNNKLIIVGNERGELNLWSLKKGFCVMRFSNHLLKINKVLFFKKSSRVAISSSKDGTLKFYDFKKCIVMRTLSYSLEPKIFNLFDINHTGFFLAASCEKTFEICLWSIKNGNLVEKLQGHRGFITNLFFFQEKFEIITTSLDCTFRLWKFEKRNKNQYECFCETFRTSGMVLCFNLHPDFSEIVLLIEKEGIFFFNLEEKKCIIRIQKNCLKFLSKKYLEKKSKKNFFLYYSAGGHKIFLGEKRGFLYYFNHFSKWKDFSNSYAYPSVDFFESPMTRIFRERKNFLKNLIDFVPSQNKRYFLILSKTVLLFSYQNSRFPEKKLLKTGLRISSQFSFVKKTVKWYFYNQKKISKVFFFQTLKNILSFCNKNDLTEKKFLFPLVKKIFFQKHLVTFHELSSSLFFIFNSKKIYFKRKRKLKLEMNLLEKKEQIMKKVKILKTKITLIYQL